ncbi:MAG: C40 family peptidase [Firmicutes bacterium]|nr:C40 family peptidase [Bacillota bacterium]
MGKATKNAVYQLKAKTSDGKWGQIANTGYWIYLSYTTPASDPNVVASTDKVKVTVTDLHFRASYSTSSKSMGKATKNTVYQLKAKTKDGKWGQIADTGYWIYLSYTVPVSDNQAEAVTVASTEKVKVTENNLRMRAGYSTSAAIKGKLSKGTVCQLKAKTKDGKWGQISDNGYWIYLEYTEPVKTEAPAEQPKPEEKAVVATSEYVKVTGTGLRMRASYSTDSEIKGYVTKGNVYQLKAKTADGKWGQLKSNGYWIYLDYAVAFDPSASDKVNSGDSATGVCTGQQVVNYALQFEGNPYKWGGTSLTNGTDCSGFTQSVYAHFGISLPRTTSEQAKVGRAVTYSQIKPGDIICYPGHVALYIGNDKVIHASTPTKGIIISPTSYRKDMTTIRRIVE